MREIHFGKKSLSKDGGYWVSFESDPHLRRTKGDIYGRCLPCIDSLYRQLIERKDKIELGEALRCWKIVVVLKNEEECLRLLEVYSNKFLNDRYVYGKYGTSKEDSDSIVVVFHTQDINDRDGILNELKTCIKEINPDANIFISRGCETLYGVLLGPWESWDRITEIKNKEIVDSMIKRIRRLLYQDQE
jgi:hypothetical protein